MLKKTKKIHAMRDPTRGGLATTLKEIASDSGYCIVLEEGSIPVPAGVKGACELLGLDPLYVANEGILIAIVKAEVAELIVKTMRKHPLGKEARIIGEVQKSPAGMVLLKDGYRRHQNSGDAFRRPVAEDLLINKSELANSNEEIQ